LAVNAWELLLKARLLQITGNQLAAILEYERRQRADGSQSKMLYVNGNAAAMPALNAPVSWNVQLGSGSDADFGWIA
jgi:hypothetical protein